MDDERNNVNDDDEDIKDDLDLFMEADEMYNVSIKNFELDGRNNVERSPINIHNVKVECSARCHGLVDHRASVIYIRVPNPY